MPTTRASRQRRQSSNAIVGGILAALDVNTDVTNKDVSRKPAAMKEIALSVSEWSDAGNDDTPKRPRPDIKKTQPTPPPASVIISYQILSPDTSASISELSSSSVDKRRNIPKFLFSRKCDAMATTRSLLPEEISYRADEESSQQSGDVSLESDQEVEDEESVKKSEHSGQDNADESDFSSENEFDEMDSPSLATESDERDGQEDSDFINDDDETVDEQNSFTSVNELTTELDDEYDPDETDEDDSSDDELEIDDEEVNGTQNPEKRGNKCEVDVIAEILHDTHVNDTEVVAIATVVAEGEREERSFLTSETELRESREDLWTNAGDDDDDKTVPFDDKTSKEFDDATGSFDYESDGSNTYQKSVDSPSDNNESFESETVDISYSRATDFSVLDDNAAKELKDGISSEEPHKAKQSIAGSCTIGEETLGNYLELKETWPETRITVGIDNDESLATESQHVEGRSCLEEVEVEAGPKWYHVAETPFAADVYYTENDENAHASQQQIDVKLLPDTSECQPNKSVIVDLSHAQMSASHISPVSARKAHSTVFTLLSIQKNAQPSPESLTNKVMALSKIHPQNKRENQREGTIRRGQWALGSKIGSGSFGVVHVGMNMQTGQLLAVKSIELSPATMTDIRREIEVLKSLEHINIVRYLGAERDEKKLHIFQEWVPGGSVADLINKFGAFSFPVIRRYLSQVLTGLTYLHKNGILHRDIKGGNVLINDDGIVKLADFGASKRLAHQQADLMESLTMRGTPYFMAPEVFEEKYGGKADVWSVGCVGFQMATGSPPWKGQGYTNPISLFSHLRKSEGPPPINWPENTCMRQSEKELFEAMLAKSFRREPSQRPTAHGLLSDPFFFEIDPSEDELSCSQGLFSPGSQEYSKFAHLMSPQLKWNSAKRLKPFMTPPLPTKIRASILCQDMVSPLLQSPKADSSNWPIWVCASEKKIVTRSSPVKSTMEDSLARSEDSGQNPFSRQCSRESETFQNSAESFSMLNGLRFLDRDIKEN